MRAWRRDLPKAFVAVVVALCLYSALGRVLPALRSVKQAVRSSPGALAERDLAPANPWSLAPFIEAAKTVVPAGATYALVVGQDPPTDDLRAAALPALLAYALAPRRFTSDPGSAQWVITYHQSSEKLGVKIGREIGLDADGNAIEVKS